MAGAEARAVWQRTSNRCFVQEDAKRAPKLACCQSSSSSSKLVDIGPAGAANEPYHPAARFMPLNMNHMYSELPSDTRWWLQMQPNYVYQKGLTSEQINAVKAEMETLKARSVDSPPKVSVELSQDSTNGTLLDGKKNSEVSPDEHYDRGVSSVCMKKNPEARTEIVDPLDCKTTQEFIELMDIRENYEFIEMDSVGCQSSKTFNESCFDPESPWTGSGKTEPWWHTTDKDDLASLVAQKSVSYMENCDLPPPQKKHTRPYHFARSQGFDLDGTSTLDKKSQTYLISTPEVHYQGSPDPRRTSVEGQMPFGSGESCGCNTTPMAVSENQVVYERDPCKAQLLEALRHSQTRAREAEMAAKEAYAEKEHILKLFFRQASQLFACKQWFQMLQLEALYVQIKNCDQPISTLFPVALPWVPRKGRKMRKNWQKAVKGKRGKQGHPKPDMSNYAVAFAFGLGLVGAGLLLGWTVGWMLPF